MILPAVLALIVGLGLIQFGAMSVWLTVLSTILKAILALAIGMAAFFGARFWWRRHQGNKHPITINPVDRSPSR